jgi:hypothetical protein
MSKRITKSFATNKNTSDDVKRWIELQDNFNDAVIYLIEKEIYSNGIRDLSSLIPKKRSDEYFSKMLQPISNVVKESYVPNVQPIPQRIEESEDITSNKSIQLERIEETTTKQNTIDEVPGETSQDSDEEIYDEYAD